MPWSLRSLAYHHHHLHRRPYPPFPNSHLRARAFRAMQRWHPDKATADVHDVVTEHASAINKAYRVLGDTEQVCACLRACVRACGFFL